MHKALGDWETPCDGCTACCKGDAVRILPHEDPTKWETEPHWKVPGARMLAHKENGDCHYLGEHGCTIQDDKPQQCYTMDCRRVMHALTPAQRRDLVKRGALSQAMVDRGLELIALHGLFWVFKS